MNRNFIADIFNWVRETLEAAESPFVLFALIILPILAPLVPAIVTGLRLRDELGFDPWIAYTTSGVLELLGYVGAIAFIKAISRLGRGGGVLSVLMTGLAYGFYVYAMYAINVRLGELAGDSAVVNQVFAILSFLTVPTGLLAAEHINERDRKEEEERLRLFQIDEKDKVRRERSAERLEIERIKAESFQKVSNDGRKDSGNFPQEEESFQKVSDWRKVREKLSKEQMERLARATPEQMHQFAREAHVTYKTISNWRTAARKELNLG